MKSFSYFVIAAILSLHSVVSLADELPTPTEKEAVDLLRIYSLSKAGNNSIFKPEYNRTNNGKAVRVFVFVSDAFVRKSCGARLYACTVTISSQDLLDAIPDKVRNAMQLRLNDVIIFMPNRDPAKPMSWFYSLGHEFAHALYGSFHPRHPR